MSHFSVAVFSDGTKSVADLLAPYQENCFDNVPREYLVFTKDDDYDFDEEMQACGYWENPNAKWDWCSIGGRWNDMLHLKSGRKGLKVKNDEEDRGPEYCSSAKVKDIDFAMDRAQYQESLRWWDVVVEGEPLRADEDIRDFATIFRKEYLRRRFKNRELYAKTQASFSTYAVVMPDGKWISPGEMGWFGASSETEEEACEWDLYYRERSIDTANPEWTLTIVDCHI